MIKDGKVYRNLESQVAYLTEYLEGNAIAAELGIKVVGEAESVSDIPEGEYDYGDAYMIGTEAPYYMYIWTRANGTHPEDYWFNVGQFPMPGPQGEPGLGIDNIANINIQNYDSISASRDDYTGITTISLSGTESVLLQDNTTVDNPINVSIPIKTDDQVSVNAYSDSNGNKAISIELAEDLSHTYVPQRSAPSNDRNYPYVYGANAPYSYNVDTLAPCLMVPEVIFKACRYLPALSLSTEMTLASNPSPVMIPSSWI